MADEGAELPAVCGGAAGVEADGSDVDVGVGVRFGPGGVGAVNKPSDSEINKSWQSAASLTSTLNCVSM